MHSKSHVLAQRHAHRSPAPGSLEPGLEPWIVALCEDARQAGFEQGYSAACAGAREALERVLRGTEVLLANIRADAS